MNACYCHPSMFIYNLAVNIIIVLHILWTMNIMLSTAASGYSVCGGGVHYDGGK